MCHNFIILWVTDCVSLFYALLSSYSRLLSPSSLPLGAPFPFSTTSMTLDGLDAQRNSGQVQHHVGLPYFQFVISSPR